jgi:hypothetical protein
MRTGRRAPGCSVRLARLGRGRRTAERRLTHALPRTLAPTHTTAHNLLSSPRRSTLFNTLTGVSTLHGPRRPCSPCPAAHIPGSKAAWQWLKGPTALLACVSTTVSAPQRRFPRFLHSACIASWRSRPSFGTSNSRSCPSPPLLRDVNCPLTVVSRSVPSNHGRRRKRCCERRR